MAVRPTPPHVLIVNPWIHDFAAYDFWAQPLGILVLAAVLRRCGITVSYVNCLDRFHPRARPLSPNLRFGRGPYPKTPIPKPGGLEDVLRRFSRYGIPPDWFYDDLRRLTPPDLILLTSMMTYWWTGVRETIGMLKEAFPEIPVVLGGVYATLCPDHAREKSGADRVLAGPGGAHILDLAGELTGCTLACLKEQSGFDPGDMNTWPYPALELQHRIPHVPLLTSLGCPFSCPYCASGVLSPKRMRRSPGIVVQEIRYWYERHGVTDYALYDDAFLAEASDHAVPILEKIVRMHLPVRFHTPNALHIRKIAPKTARLLKEAGFVTLRLGLETAGWKDGKRWDHKVTLEEFSQAAAFLLEAGFTRHQVGAYLLAGLPGQSFSSVASSIGFVKACGVRPIPAYYSPIPHTALWKDAVASSRYPLESDPIFTNNAIFPCQKEPFSWEAVSRIKALCA